MSDEAQPQEPEPTKPPAEPTPLQVALVQALEMAKTLGGDDGVYVVAKLTKALTRLAK